MTKKKGPNEKHKQNSFREAKKQLLQEGKRNVEKVQVPKRVLNESKYERIDYEYLASMDLWPLKGFNQSIERLLFGREHDVVRMSSDGLSSEYIGLGLGMDEEDGIELPEEIIDKINKFRELVKGALSVGALQNHGSDDEEIAVASFAFLKWFRKKGFVVPDDLIPAMERGELKKAVSLLKELRELFLLNRLSESEPIAESAVNVKAQNIMAEMSKKGGEHSNLLLGVIAAVKHILEENKELTSNQVWIKLKPFTSDNPLEVKGYEIYVDGKTLCQNDTVKAKIKSIEETSFPRYVSRAKVSCT
ncbi:MAG: hypothetical protein HN472_05700 [Nitrospina sp.]|jgi:hypothetical protein|nr:hypothetical protein [Nitrospina sp.]MBT3922861.1 hypothetical protein [Nitrospina sp.]